MPSARLLGVLVTLAFLVAFLGIPLALWWEGRRPSSYPAQREALEEAGVVSMADWRALSTEEQEAADTASLDLGEQAELDAVDDAREAAAFLAHHVQVNARYRS
jgi:hypothetical protein